MTDPTELLALAVEVAGRAAALVRERGAGDVSVAATKTSAVDVVTEADRASEALIRARLLAARPDDGFLGEEGGTAEGTSGVRWVVDPIDGTVNFLYGIAPCAVSIAAEVDGRVVAGVVADVDRGTTYTASLDGGAHRDGAPLKVRGPAPVAERLVLTGFGYDAALRARQAEGVARMLPRVRDIRRLGSCALDLCHVAQGTADAYVEEGVQPWDHAAAALVAVEAGARCALVPGATGLAAVVCAPAHGYDEFLDLVVDCGLVAGNRPASGE